MRKSFIIIGIVLFLIFNRTESATQASCSEFKNVSWYLGGQIQDLTRCLPEIDVVDDENFTIAAATEQTITAISIEDKPAVKFLPVNLFSSFPDLIVFEMFYCSVTSVNKIHFENLSKLRYLKLSYNKIENIPTDAFDDLVSLENLSLNYNKIRFPDGNTFASLKSLKFLFYEGNEIQSLDKKIFRSLTNLKVICLGYNKLQEIPERLFKNNLKLETVDLRGNKIKCIDSNIFEHLQKMKLVYLQNNLCINSEYNEKNFDKLKNDLTVKCSCAMQNIGTSSLLPPSNTSDLLFTQSDTCGVPKHSLGLIVRGQSFPHGAFPWIVALMHTRWRPPKFFCAGTLISKTFVVSAAHCILQKGADEKLLPRDMLALFGTHDLNKQYELGRIALSPKKIFIHDDWNHMTSSYDADISLLEFEKNKLQFDEYIQPICLWTTATDPNVTEGVVTGWGRSEDRSKKHENLPKLVSALIQPNEDCFLDEGKLLPMSSKRTFCAGLRNGSGVCSGDSGGGLFIKINGVFHLKGIVSSSLIKDNDCDVSRNAVYTNVLKFKDWIKSKILSELATSARIIDFNSN